MLYICLSLYEMRWLLKGENSRKSADADTCSSEAPGAKSIVGIQSHYMKIENDETI